MEFRQNKQYSISYDVLIIDKKSRELCVGKKALDVDVVATNLTQKTAEGDPFFEFTLKLNSNDSNIVHILSGFLIQNKITGLTIAFITNNSSLKRALRHGLYEKNNLDR